MDLLRILQIGETTANATNNKNFDRQTTESASASWTINTTFNTGKIDNANH